jgi:co-chaperonin GroES (HSP10)
MLGEAAKELGTPEFQEALATVRAEEVAKVCPLQPLEYNVIVQPDAPKEKIGSIYLAPTTQDADRAASDEGVLVAVSPMAFNFPDWPEGERKPRVGDRVVWNRYQGNLRKGQNGAPDLRILKDKDILAVIKGDD